MAAFTFLPYLGRVLDRSRVWEHGRLDAGPHASRNPRAALGWTQVVRGLERCLGRLEPELLPALLASQSCHFDEPLVTFQLDLARCLWAVLPGACLWGASFPLALAAVAPHAQDAGRPVSRVYAANTIGAILGALTFSLFIVPRFGTQWAQRFLICLAGAATIAAWIPGRRGRRTRFGCNSLPNGLSGARGVALIFGIAGLMAGLAWTVTQIPWGVVAYGR